MTTVCQCGSKGPLAGCERGGRGVWREGSGTQRLRSTVSMKQATEGRKVAPTQGWSEDLPAGLSYA